MASSLFGGLRSRLRRRVLGSGRTRRMWSDADFQRAQVRAGGVVHRMTPMVSRQQSAASRGIGAKAETEGMYAKKYQMSVDDPEEFWRKEAKNLTWREDFHTVKEECLLSGAISWFDGGKLNVSENCLDRHVRDGNGDKTAIVWEMDEPGNTREYSYREVLAETCRLANVIKKHLSRHNLGLNEESVVTLYMPVCPHAVFAMLACARLGVPHSIVFAGFSAAALADRIHDSRSAVVLTADEGVRGGKVIPLKATAEKALEIIEEQHGYQPVKSVLVYDRNGAHEAGRVGMLEGRDFDLVQEMKQERPVCPPEAVSSEHPLFRLYTSGSTGKPKPVVHSSGGFLLYAMTTIREVFELRPSDVFGCMADVGWITGHTYTVYGPLASGATTVIFESLPTYPDAGRYWDMVERLGITQIYTAPTAIRVLMKECPSYVEKHDLSSLRVLGSVGEPINPEAWKWYSETVGKGNCPIVDTWWQTETGGIMITPLPFDHHTAKAEPKPGAAVRPFYGVQPVLIDPVTGDEIEGNDVTGVLCLKTTTPGFARTLAGDHSRFVSTYLDQYKGYYFSGDQARRDEDGHLWITGRVDDVINVSGHRIATAEIESALMASGDLSEAAVVGYPHPVKGESMCAFVLKNDANAEDTSDAELAQRIKTHIRNEIGPFACPEKFFICDGLPKTRSGKVMRRILRKLAVGETEELGDLSTLNDPSIVQHLIEVSTGGGGGEKQQQQQQQRQQQQQQQQQRQEKSSPESETASRVVVQAKVYPTSGGVMDSVGFNTLKFKIPENSDSGNVKEVSQLNDAVYLVNVEGQSGLSLAFFDSESGVGELVREDGKLYRPFVNVNCVSIEVIEKLRDKIPGLCTTKEQLRLQVNDDISKAIQIKNLFSDGQYDIASSSTSPNNNNNQEVQK